MSGVRNSPQGGLGDAESFSDGGSGVIDVGDQDGGHNGDGRDAAAADAEDQVADGDLHAGGDALHRLLKAEPIRLALGGGLWRGVGENPRVRIAPSGAVRAAGAHVERNLDIVELHARGLRREGGPGDVELELSGEGTRRLQGEALEERREVQFEVLQDDVTSFEGRPEVGCAGPCGTGNKGRCDGRRCRLV